MIVESVGAAVAGREDVSKRIQEAMNAAVRACRAAGVVDDAAIRAAMLEARRRVKEGQ